jgi:hypothetical protein
MAKLLMIERQSAQLDGVDPYVGFPTSPTILSTLPPD